MTDQFPAGLRVLVVDDDRTCLAILEKMLLRCAYHVTTCGTARVALAKLRENRQCYDLVISDVYMPDMDGFKLLELVGLEMDLPVIMMSADGETSVVMKGITHGACDYLIKPIRMKELRNIWQHVIRKRRNVIKDMDVPAAAEEDRSRRRLEEVDGFMSANSRKRKETKEEEEDEFDTEDSTTLKKPRVVWSIELHQQFVTAVNQLGIDKAVPKRILELMHVQGLTRENVASHLQKYRLYLKRLSMAQQQNAISMTSAGQPSFDVLPSHPVISPGSSQTLAAIQSAYLARPNGLGSGAAASTMESQQPVFVVRPHIPQANNQRSLFPTLHDSEQLAKPPHVPSLGQPSAGLQDAASAGVPESNLLPAAASSGLDEVDLAERLLHQQKQVAHYVQKPDDAYVQHPVLRNPPTLLDGIPGEINKPPLVKCEPDAALNGGWNFRLGWNAEPDMLQTAVGAASYSMSNAADRHNYVAGLLAPNSSNSNLKVKTEQLLYGMADGGGAAAAAGTGFSTRPEQIVDDLSTICYKQEPHEAGFFYSDSLGGLEGYVHGNLYVK